MKSVLLIIVFNLINYNNEIMSIRSLYLNASKSEYHCNKFGEKINEKENVSSILIKGYEACFYFIKCKFIDNPIEKISYFNKGKKLLESLIEENPDAIELRFLRYSIQKNLPRVLLYYDNIEKDLNFVYKNIDNIKDSKTKSFILSSIKSIKN